MVMSRSATNSPTTRTIPLGSAEASAPARAISVVPAMAMSEDGDQPRRQRLVGR
jgi:hypothetical protein